jgi:transcriptional regulator with XRE-family HTH domain
MPKKFKIEGIDEALDKLRLLLRRERERRGWSQKKVAQMIGISEPYLSQLENADRHIYWEVFVAWCGALRLSPSYIVGKWQRTGGFNGFDREQIKEYHKVIDDMIQLDFRSELDNLMFYFKGLIAQELEARRREADKKKFSDLFRKREERETE